MVVFHAKYPQMLAFVGSISVLVNSKFFTATRCWMRWLSRSYGPSCSWAMWPGEPRDAVGWSAVIIGDKWTIVNCNMQIWWDMPKLLKWDPSQDWEARSWTILNRLEDFLPVFHGQWLSVPELKQGRRLRLGHLQHPHRVLLRWGTWWIGPGVPEAVVLWISIFNTNNYQ